MKNKVFIFFGIAVIVMLIFNVILIREVWRERHNCSIMSRSLIYYKENIHDIFVSGNTKMENILLVDHLGINRRLMDVHQEYGDQLLIIYFPNCICAVEKDKFLKKIDTIYQKGIING